MSHNVPILIPVPDVLPFGPPPQPAGVDKVEIRDQRARDNVVTFTLIVTFKPGALAPAAS